MFMDLWGIDCQTDLVVRLREEECLPPLSVKMDIIPLRVRSAPNQERKFVYIGKI